MDNIEIRERALDCGLLQILIDLSEDWAAENSCWGYRANTEEDIKGNRIFTAEKDGETVGYLFGHTEQSKSKSSVMPEKRWSSATSLGLR